MSNPVLDFVSSNSTLLNAGAQLVGNLLKIGLEYITANQEKRAELLADADHEYATFRETLSGLDQAIAANNTKADAEITAKFDKGQ